MIRTLNISNYAIIDQLEIQFSDNLTIITGETGAGKSIILGALGLILGKRADTRMLYDQSKKCVVEAHFNIADYQLQNFFEEHDLDYEEGTIIRREITPSGKSRAFINDTPTKLTVLQALANQLIDLHQQFDTLDIHNYNFQRNVVDAIAGNKGTMQSYTSLYKSYDKKRRQLQQLIENSQQASKELDFIQYQLEELHEAALEAGEQDSLEAEQHQLTHAEEIKVNLNLVSDQLTENELAVTGQLNELIYKIQDIAAYHKKLPPLVERFEGVVYELQDLASEFQRIGDDTEYDGERLHEVNERLDVIYKLQNKHHVSNEEELLEVQAGLEEQLKGFEDLSGNIATLEKDIEKEEATLFKLGEQLYKKRTKAAPQLEKQVKKLLAQLSMPYAQLKVELVDTKQLTPNGIDTLRFLFASNKGSRFEEVKNVASGGELSRLALCIKSLIADAITLPTLIFDEIDSGVSGEVALQMGIILQNLSDAHQVITITHSPQIAAKGNKHYFVHKKVMKDRTLTRIKALEEDERILEIAKMLSGNPPTEFAKENARELMVR